MKYGYDLRETSCTLNILLLEFMHRNLTVMKKSVVTKPIIAVEFEIDLEVRIIKKSTKPDVVAGRRSCTVLHVMYLTNDLTPQSLPSFCGVASASGIVPRLQEGSTACGREMFI